MDELTWLRFFFFLLLRVKWIQETADKVTTTTTTISWEFKAALNTNRGEWRRRSPNLFRLFGERSDEAEDEDEDVGGLRLWLQPRKLVREEETNRGEINLRERWLLKSLLTSMDDEEEEEEGRGEREWRMKH